MVLTDLGLSLVEGLTDPAANQPAPAPIPNDLTAQVKATVLARMGNGVSEELLDAIIPKVLAQLNIQK